MGTDPILKMKLFTYTRWILFSVIILILKITFLWLVLTASFHLEFVNESHQHQFEVYLFKLFPLMLLSTLIGTIQKKYGILRNVLLVIKTIVVSFFIYVGILFSVLATWMCGFSEQKTVYINKKNKNKIIQEGYFGCGATDSGPYKKSYREKISFLGFIMLQKRIDPDKINPDQWIQVIPAKKLNISPIKVKNKIDLG